MNITSQHQIAQHATIAFLARCTDEEEKQWLLHLRQTMPSERIVPFAEMTAIDKSTVQLAIVANPNPQDLLKLPALRWVHSVWAGVERLLAQCPDVSWHIVRLQDPQLATTMAQAVLAWVLYLHRDMPSYTTAQQAKRWQPLPMKLTAQCTVLILGMGQLGAAAAVQLQSQGFNVIGWSRTQKQLDAVTSYAGDAGLKVAVSMADIVVCLLPLTPQTRYLINQSFFCTMPSWGKFDQLCPWCSGAYSRHAQCL